MTVNPNEDIEFCPLCGGEVSHIEVYGYECESCGEVCIKAWGYE